MIIITGVSRSLEEKAYFLGFPFVFERINVLRQARNDCFTDIDYGLL
jgi:hypothetical protein